MLRLLRLPALLWLGVVLLRADGADDAYIRIYNLVQQADANRVSGHLSDARDAYAEARSGLMVLRQNFPAWNERVVSYRLRYVTEKLEALKDVPSRTGTPPGTVVSTNGPASEVAANGEVLAQFERLNTQIRLLGSEKQLLEAKLREALTAQPAPVDPREFQAAIDRINSLQTTNKTLVQQLESQQAERRNRVEKVLVEEARGALNEANRKLLEQQVSATRIEKEKQEIEDRLKRLQEGTVKSLQSENTSLKQQVGELKSDTDRGRQVAELAGKLSKLQTDLEDTRRRNEQLAGEKAALERQVEDFKARSSEEGIVKIRKLESDLAAARLTANRNVAEAELIAASLTKEKQARSDLELANRSLQSRVEELTQGMANDAATVKSLQSTLAVERTERDSMQAELRAAEEKVALLARSSTNDTGTLNARSVELAASRTEISRLRAALKDGAEREAGLKAALRQAEDWRARFVREKADLEKRLAAALAAPAAVPAPAPALATPTAAAKTVSRLESRVRDLEKERMSLQKKVEELTRASQAGLATNRGWRAITPRERVEELHRLRR